MNMLINILYETWIVTVEMAPYLLFGFLAAGIMSVLLPKKLVHEHLGGHGLIDAIKAALIGVPLPICSCGVIPLAASLRKEGASRGATASFLASTPQTGVDSLLVTYGLLGWGFAVFRALAAFISGVFCGTAVSLVSMNDADEPIENTTPASSGAQPRIIKRILTHGFITLPRDLSKAVFLGLLISGILSSFIPDDFFSDTLGSSPLAMLAMLLIGIPLYVCSSASVPIALAFIKAGISPGAALVFLITGPATNAATLTTLWTIIGKKQLVTFLITLSLTAVCAGLLMNMVEPTLDVKEQICHDHSQQTPVGVLSGVLLVALLFCGIITKRLNP